MTVARIIFWVIIAGGIGSLVYFACQKEPAAPVAVSAGAPAVRAAEFAPGKLQENYARYGYQFRDSSQEQFWMDAQALLNTPAGPNLQEQVMPNGDVMHFRVSTGELAVMDRDGRILVYKRTDQAHWRSGTL